MLVISARFSGTGVVEVRLSGGGFGPRRWGARTARFDNGAVRTVLIGTWLTTANTRSAHV
ncbi:hypothetical protein [Streptomyces griseofuscus]|uniref:hypothetical protein n=1 Tax=Streptomyces griseofuscus TaxID=146922 RepID=UPI001189206C|nr:hypothetical protein SRO_2970 [Streptomyces rochei]